MITVSAVVTFTNESGRTIKLQLGDATGATAEEALEASIAAAGPYTFAILDDPVAWMTTEENEAAHDAETKADLAAIEAERARDSEGADA